MTEARALIALVAFAFAVLTTLAAMTQWILAVRQRVPGLAWWKASLLGDAQLTEKGREHRRRWRRFMLVALGMWLIAGLLATLALCCAAA